MHYQQLGKSDLRVSALSFGCMSLSPVQSDADQILHYAHEQGINFFDTADLYDKGVNERLVGKALKDRRSQVYIATKVGNQWRPDGSTWDWNPGKKYILEAVEESLKRLQTDYIDLYQLHGGTIEDPIDETIEAFEQLKQQGKIRHYGISSIRPNVIREYVNRSSITSVMMQYSLLDRRPEETCLDLLHQHSIGVLVRGSLAKGLLINKPATSYLGYQADEVKKAAEAIHSLSQNNRTATAVAFQFAKHHPAVTTAVTGIRTMDQLKTSLQAQNAVGLTESEYNQLTQSVRPIFYEEHR
ncbi:aldo/keto reductase [Cytophagaceae bacterium DM2B3-1]|uniref:Aldo/keto reductase n=1 Tax=Xanthocytophaga flava TaxID=3048013 RepID=A0ABT7CGA7_9BACT|nr:aldo/keto reductase [Xanthocytophaga flavus]MDJ1492778.1 aldo/keto reductase [Xanthocytophaga flavus]